MTIPLQRCHVSAPVSHSVTSTMPLEAKRRSRRWVSKDGAIAGFYPGNCGAGALRTQSALSDGALLHLAAAHPGLSLELDFRDHFVDLIEAGLDLAIRNGPVGAGVGTGLATRCIARNRRIFCAAASYMKRRGLLSSPDDLAEHEAIVYCRDGRTQIWQVHRCDGPPAQLMPPARLRLNGLGAMLDSVLADQGIAWLPASSYLQ